MAITCGGLSVTMIDNDSDLYAVWPKVRDGINAIEKRCKGVFYRPEDVYHELKQKQATLLVSIDIETDEYAGFAVIKEVSYPDGKGMHLWALHNASGGKNFVEDMLDTLEIIAKLCNVVRVSYSSSRKGWGKRTQHKGYQRVASIHYFERAIL